MPIVPWLTDREEDLDALARGATRRERGVVGRADVLYLMPDSRNTFMAFLQAKFPRLVARYREWYGRNVDAPESYRKEMAARIENLRRKYGLGSRPRLRGGVLAITANAAWHSIKENRNAERTIRRRKRAATVVRRRALRAMCAPAPAEEKPVRGVKLKTVSTFTLIFALLCVAAFAAGRPPAFAAGTTGIHRAKGAIHVSRTANRRIPGKRSRQSQGLVQQRTRLCSHTLISRSTWASM